jgi:hypothetical protein
MDDYFEMVLGDARYVGENHYIIRHMSRGEILPILDIATINAFGKMYVGYRVRVEWPINWSAKKEIQASH